MTQEEKLEEAKRLYKTANQDRRYVLEKLFPELKESEDEQVRKEIIEFLQDCNAIDSGYFKKYCKTTIDKMITWLEKQGEQKPRYSVGDVLCDKSCTTLNKESQSNFEITDIRNGMYICDKCSFPISQQDEYELVSKRIEQKPADLEEFISELSKQFPDVSFAKLSRIAVRTAKWAKPTDEEMKELLRTEYEKGRADVIAEMQKSAWSIEDGKSLNRIVGALKCMVMDYNVDDEETLEKDISWLKSLKERL